jgi:hypothetical protein
MVGLGAFFESGSDKINIDAKDRDAEETAP